VSEGDWKTSRESDRESCFEEASISPSSLFSEELYRLER
jgi:hypothetical protein